MNHPVWVWGVPLSHLTLAGAVESVERLVEEGRPSYFITANAHYAMVTERLAELRLFNENAAFILADGAPLVWASRFGPAPLPERVAGSDLIFELARTGAANGFRFFFLGGAPGVGEEAARRLEARYPGFTVVGVEAPPFRAVADPEEETALVERIRSARPDILFVAYGQPKGELFLARHFERLGVPVCAQVGASLDFAAGRVRRAPMWVRRIGMEWAFRLAVEPRRLLPRYAANSWFILRMVGQDFMRWIRRQGPRENARQPVGLEPQEASTG